MRFYVLGAIRYGGWAILAKKASIANGIPTCKASISVNSPASDNHCRNLPFDVLPHQLQSLTFNQEIIINSCDIGMPE